MSSARLSQPLGRQAARALMVLGAVAAAALFPAGAAGEQASQPTSAEAGFLDVGNFHSCAAVAAAAAPPPAPVRCWGYGGNGQLGYATSASVGDDEAPDAVGPVPLGAGRTAKAISAGTVHTCAVLDNGTVRCWGYGGNGRLGYPHTGTVGAEQPPSAAGPVDLGEDRTATAIAAGNGHTCAVLDDGSVLCWGYGNDGRLGYGNPDTIGDDETPGSIGPVPLGGKAKAVSVGGFHTCALLVSGDVNCWGVADLGRLGYGNTEITGRTPEKTPDKVGTVNLGAGRTAKAITTGLGHTCAILDDDSVRCWGFGATGRLGYANRNSVGGTPSTIPALLPSVDLGENRTARAISAGTEHTCALLDNGSVRCWGYGGFGQLGYGDTRTIGDNEHPGSAGPVALGDGRIAVAISAGDSHTCARLDDASVRCWGYGSAGRLGYCDERTIGDDELPSSAGPVAFGLPGVPGTPCPAAPLATPPPSPAGAATAPTITYDAPVAPPVQADELAAAIAAQRIRAAALRDCRRDVSVRLAADRRRALGIPSSRRRLARRQAAQRAARGRTACLRRHGRTPGTVSGLAAKASAGGRLKLSFRVAGTDGSKPPAARRYLVKQSERPIRTAADFRRAAALCRGTCSFDVERLDATATLTITDLRRNRRYYYAVAARDNVSGRVGPRSKTVTTRAR